MDLNGIHKELYCIVSLLDDVEVGSRTDEHSEYYKKHIRKDVCNIIIRLCELLNKVDSVTPPKSVINME